VITVQAGLTRLPKPSITEFLDDLAKFINVDEVRTTHGARESKFAIMHALCEPGDTIIVDGNAHYTTHLAAERNKLEMIEVPNSGHPEYKITPQKYQETLENTIDKWNRCKISFTYSC